jgi:hypothetical protein
MKGIQRNLYLDTPWPAVKDTARKGNPKSDAFREMQAFTICRSNPAKTGWPVLDSSVFFNSGSFR